METEIWAHFYWGNGIWVKLGWEGFLPNPHPPFRTLYQYKLTRAHAGLTRETTKLVIMEIHNQRPVCWDQDGKR